MKAMLAGQSAAASLRAACLQEVRSVLRLSGAGLLQFLQGIVTNDVTVLEAPGSPPQYACVLNAQGRYLHDMLLHRTKDPVPTLLLDVDSQGKSDLLRLLKRYRLRQKVDIDDASQQYRVWALYGSGSAELAAAHDAQAPGWAPDPRLRQLGLRAVLPTDADGSASGVSSQPASIASCQDYRRWRILHGISEGDTEIPTGEVVPLEFNIDGLSGISFSKGCYVGQELMARTHFKGVVRKRLMPFVAAPSSSSSSSLAGHLQEQRQLGGGMVPALALAAAEASAQAASVAPEEAAGQADGGVAAEAVSGSVQPGAAVYVEQQSGKRKAVGVVRVADGALGLAVLRLSAVDDALAAGQPLLVGEGESRLELLPWRPDWWPAGWGREEAAVAPAPEP